MANAPAALDVYLGMSGALAKSGLAGKEQEVIQLAVAEANHCGYCADAHTVIGKMYGLTEAQTIEARRGSLADPRLNAVAKFALALHEKRGSASDADIAAFKQAGFTDANIAEAVASYALALYTNSFNHVNHTTSDVPPAPKV
jgi:AhpD family alkylhydroperoxidase